VTLKGTVVRGDGIGRKLGFPTANLDFEGPPPPSGVWFVKVAGYGKGVCNVGTRPTAGGTRLVVEAHLLEFSGDLYGKTLELEFVSRLRDEKKFPSFDALKAQIALDVAAAKDLK
jgi:riboflavin kinase / FMN adenylyltransferase